MYLCLANVDGSFFFRLAGCSMEKAIYGVVFPFSLKQTTFAVMILFCLAFQHENMMAPTHETRGTHVHRQRKTNTHKKTDLRVSRTRKSELWTNMVVERMSKWENINNISGRKVKKPCGTFIQKVRGGR